MVLFYFMTFPQNYLFVSVFDLLYPQIGVRRNHGLRQLNSQSFSNIFEYLLQHQYCSACYCYDFLCAVTIFISINPSLISSATTKFHKPKYFSIKSEVFSSNLKHQVIYDSSPQLKVVDSWSWIFIKVTRECRRYWWSFI